MDEESKDGLRLIDISTEGVVQENTTYLYTIKNPLGYIYSTISPYDWYTDNSMYQNNTLWGNGTVKNVNDPCPGGWRIPSSGIWIDFSAISLYYIRGEQTVQGDRTATNGRLYKHLTWLPTAGYRHFRSGVLSYIGYSGYFWSMLNSEQLAICMSFNISGLNPQGEHNRATGMSVRCIQE